MKLKLLTGILLLLSVGSFARKEQPLIFKHDYQLLVGLNLRDCISCVGGKLNQIGKLNKAGKDVDVILVMGKQYAPDSTAIINRFNLHAISRQIIWSSKLLNEITGGGSSSVLFSSKYARYGTLTYKYLLERVPNYLFRYFDRADLPVDSLFSDYPDITLGNTTAGLDYIYSNEGKVYFINAILGGVNGYDLLSGKKIFHFDMPDSILRATFSYSGLPGNQCDIQHKLLLSSQMAPYKINALAFDGDTIYLEFSNIFLIPDKQPDGRPPQEGDSIAEKTNTCIIKMVNGHVSHVFRITSIFKNPFDHQKIYQSDFAQLYYYDKAICSFIFTDSFFASTKPIM